MGIRCAHDGAHRLNKPVKALADKKKFLPVCPEVLGGLSIPRERSEIAGGAGLDLLRGRAKVVTESGTDVSDCYLKGARYVLGLAKRCGIKRAILKSKSPACGTGLIYDGTFRGVLRRGDGVLAALLKLHGIEVYSESASATKCLKIPCK